MKHFTIRDLPHQRPTRTFKSRKPQTTNFVFALCLGTACTVGLSSAKAATLNMYHRHDVPEFTDPKGTIATTTYAYPSPNEIFRHDIEYDSRLPCCSSGSATNVIRTFADLSHEQFGSTAKIRATDVGAETRSIEAGGQIAFAAEFLGDPIFKFRISRTELEAAQNTTAQLYFSIFVHELADQARDVYDTVDQFLAGPTIAAAQYKAVLFGGDSSGAAPSITITQSGFDTPLQEPDLFAFGTRQTGWDFGVFDGVLDLFDLGVRTGDRVGVSYNWSVNVVSEAGGFPGTAYASFFDPLSTDSGLSFDGSNLSELTIGGGTTPSPVPVPAALFFGLTGLSGLFVARSGRGRARPE